MSQLNEIEEALKYANENLSEIDGEDEITTKALTQLAALREGFVLVPMEIIDVAMSSPELNPCNYGHDQVCKLNSAMVEICTYFAAQTTEKPNEPL